MRAAVMKLAPALVAIAAVATVAACSKTGEEHVTATGDELSAEFSAQAVSTSAESYESPLPSVNLPTVDATSGTTSS